MDKSWQNFIKNHGELKLRVETTPKTLEKSFFWLVKSVSPTLKLIDTIGKSYGVDLLALIIASAELSPDGEKILEVVEENPEWFQDELTYYQQTLLQEIEKQSTANIVHDTPP